ncbi:hypothetical protein BH24CHL5_BH24CHL5_05320 [soil metagenome]
MAARRFPIRLGRWARWFLLLFGVTQSRAYVDMNGQLAARFGFFRLTTPLDNITRWRIEGPWLAIRAIGVRGSGAGDVTFGGNAEGGVRLDFRERPRFWPLRPVALYVTVADMEGLGAALSEHGIPGEDCRREASVSVDAGAP